MNPFFRFAGAAFLAALISLTPGCARWIPKFGPARAPLRTVPSIDLPRLMGDWRVIAHIPHSADKGWVDTIQSYALRPDGKIESWITFRKKSFDAPQNTVRTTIEVVNHQTNAEWSVSRLGFSRTKYLIVDLDPNYQWAVIGDPSRSYAWILARDRSLPVAAYDAIFDRLAVRGYDPAKFLRVPQHAGQEVGRGAR